MSENLYTIIHSLDAVHNFYDLGSKLADHPEILISAKGFAHTLSTINRLMAGIQENDSFSMKFITTIIDTYRQREVSRGLYAYKVDLRDWNTERDWCLVILRHYVRAMIEKTKGQCLHFTKSLGNAFTAHMYGQSIFEYMGWLFLLFDYNNSMYDPVLETFLKEYPIEETIEAFLLIISDTELALTDEKTACHLVANAWIHDATPDEQSDLAPDWYPGCTFITKCKEMQMVWFDTRVRSLSEYDRDIHEYNIADCHEIFVSLANIFGNKFNAENQFFNYISEVCYYYPLTIAREDIAKRYDRYFDGAAFLYMSDIVTCCIRNVEDLRSYKTTPILRSKEVNIAKALEHIILRLHRDYPEVDLRVISTFIEDTLHSFSRGYKGFTEGMMLMVDDMIDALAKSDGTVAEESDIDYWDLMMAMENSFSTNVKNTATKAVDKVKTAAKTITTKKTPGTNSGTLHQKADTSQSNVKNTMKDAERKIYSAYHKYKTKEEDVDNALTKGIQTIKKMITGDQQAILIEGKKFSAIGFLKKALATVAIFNYSKIGLILFLVVKKVLTSKTKKAEKRKLLLELNAELEMVNEKIEDAKGDGNRQAKYDLMRTRQALQSAIQRLKYGIGAEEKEPVLNPDRVRNSTANYSVRKYRG